MLNPVSLSIDTPHSGRQIPSGRADAPGSAQSGFVDQLQGLAPERQTYSEDADLGLASISQQVTHSGAKRDGNDFAKSPGNPLRVLEPQGETRYTYQPEGTQAGEETPFEEIKLSSKTESADTIQNRNGVVVAEEQFAHTPNLKKIDALTRTSDSPTSRLKPDTQHTLNSQPEHATSTDMRMKLEAMPSPDALPERLLQAPTGHHNGVPSAPDTALTSLTASTTHSFLAASTPQPIVAAATPPSSLVLPAAVPVISAPSEIVDIISQKLGTGDNAQDRIVVQLDPPELGRVSIDFKFDAAGLQHITVTGETPEALRQLRLMHADLLQALQQNGLTGDDLDFRQGLFNQRSFADNQLPEMAGALHSEASLESHEQTDGPKPVRIQLPAGGLDIKV